MSRRASVLLLIAVVAAFAWGWHAGLFGTRPASQEAHLVPEAAKPVPDGEGRAGTASIVAPNASGSGVDAASAPAGRADDAGRDAGNLSFDIVRVEPDGSAVIAGRGRPNETVALMNGDAKLAEGRTNASGDFALNLTLPEGAYRLRLARPGDGASGDLSPDAAVVNVPTKGRENELMVMMERPGQPVDILVKPQVAPLVAAVEARAPETARATETPVASNPGATPAPSPSRPEPRGDAPVAGQPVLPGSLAVEAVEIEGGKLFIAGSAADKSSVRIYLDGRFVAEAQGGAGERFIASAMADVPVGDHVIRADQVDAAGRVVARAEVPFNRPDNSAMSAVAGMVNPNRSASATPAASGSPAIGSQADPVVGSDRAGGAISGDGRGEADVATAASDAASPSTSPDGLRTMTQAPLETVATPRVIIRRGDTLWRISRETYGRGSRYTVIYLANGDQIRNPNRIYPGQVFQMPKDEGAKPRG